MRVLILLISLTATACSGLGPKLLSSPPILVRAASNQQPEPVTNQDATTPLCRFTNEARCPIIVKVAAYLDEQGKIQCGVTGVDPGYLNVHGRDVGWLVWRTNEVGLFKNFQFKPVDGIDIIGNDKRFDFLDLERDDDSDANADNRVRRRVLNLRAIKLKFHYNINLQYREHPILDPTHWVDCTPYDPVIVNRD